MVRPRQWSSWALHLGSAAIAAVVAGWLLHAGTGRGLDAQVVNPPEGPLAVASSDDLTVLTNLLEDAGVDRRIGSGLEAGACAALRFERLGWAPFQPAAYAAELDFGAPPTRRVIVGYVRDPLASPPAAPPDTIVSARVSIPSSQRQGRRAPVFRNPVEFGFLRFVLRDVNARLSAPLGNSKTLFDLGVEFVSGVGKRQSLLAWFEYSDGRGGVSTITVTGECSGQSTYCVTSVR